MLTDALYLDADWAAPFPASQTRPGPFTTASGRQVSAEFLHGGAFRSVSAGGWTAVSLPYRGGKLAMTALLPDSGSGGCPALSARDPERLAGAFAMPRTGGGLTDIVLPKVSLRSSASLGNLLAGLGMGVAFDGGADFTGLSPQACCIGLVLHAATLAVAEKGTVGSAATAVGITADRDIRAAGRRRVRPAVRAAGDRHRDRGAALPGPGGRPSRLTGWAHCGGLIPREAACCPGPPSWPAARRTRDHQ